MTGHPFLDHAFLGGVPIAALCGMVGWFMVLRRQIFTADALSHVAFTGALGALALGLDARVGLFAATLVIAVVLGGLGQRGQRDDVVTGAVFAWVLGLGVLALSIYTSSIRATANGAAGVNVLFGSIFGLSAATARTAAVIAVALLVLLVAISRPLLFSSLDEAVAGARRVPATALGLVFLLIAGASTAEAGQAVGAMLLLGLLAAPAGAAHRLTSRPYVGMALSGALSTSAMIVGLSSSYLLPHVPPSFSILATATLIYGLTLLPRPRVLTARLRSPARCAGKTGRGRPTATP